MLRLVFLAPILALAAGCMWFDPDEEGVFLDPADDYMDARQHDSLVIPEDLQQLEDTDPFPIPPIADRANPAFYPDRPPLPDAIYGDSNVDEVRLQRLGERRWLVIPEAPTTAWPKLKQFLADNGVPVTYDAPEVGRLNTDWLRVEGTETYRDVIRTVTNEAKGEAGIITGMDRYLIRVEQGMRPNSTEIHLRHENDSQGLPMPDNVDSLRGVESHVAKAEAELLNEVGAYIAAKVAETTVSKVALQIGSARKSELGRNVEGYPLLRLFLDFDRAWATLGQALGNAEVDVLDVSREEGIYKVSIPPTAFGDESNDGFLCRLTFSCDDKGGLEVVLRVDVVQEIVDGGYDVTVHGQEGRFYDPEVSQQVLVMIRDYAT
jgi:outer membrane protein assembly factor BamC